MPRLTIPERAVDIETRGGMLHGDLVVPQGTSGVVVFAHGSGSSCRLRSRFVAETLNAKGHGTLLMDLLTEAEERMDAVTPEYRFDIDLLAWRLGAAVDWIGAQPESACLRIGVLGASTGAAAALIAAAERPDRVHAVVSHAGRPDLAQDYLQRVVAPTLLVVCGSDDLVIELNREALSRLQCEKRLEIVPGATDLFGDPRALASAARLAADWFTRHL